jgi:hypothetical protein
MLWLFSLLTIIYASLSKNTKIPEISSSGLFGELPRSVLWANRNRVEILDDHMLNRNLPALLVDGKPGNITRHRTAPPFTKE